MNGRPKGLPNKVNRGARAVFEAHQRQIAESLIELTKETRGEGKEPCPFCRRDMPRDENVRIKAMDSVLDRGGTPKVAAVEVTDKSDFDWLEYTTGEEAEAIFVIIEAARARMPVNAEREPEADDAETVM